jgi:hypothetical protein
MSSPSGGARGWLFVAWGVGIALALPAGWLLAYLSALPAFLGLFFFLLVGLMIGAAMFRLASPARPLPRYSRWVMSVSVASIAWLTGLAVEYRWLPRDAADLAIRRSLRAPAAEQELLRAEIREHIAEHLASTYPPGGFTGYVRWAATSGKIDVPRLGGDGTVTYQLMLRPSMWIVRTVLSLVLGSFSILSQLLGLERAREPEPAATEEDAAAPR